ncbi:DsbA family protein [Saccharibacillus sacchari]|uniref:DsbA family protein n=1 Tax=Saccharibacillus sacchari TaxID=456493 RepID=A0ACC6PHF9_9BACL
MTQENNELIYIWDAYCGWCYGFSSTLGKLHANHSELPLSVWSGGLFTGDHAQPIGNFPHIASANVRIEEMTGAEFGAAYDQLLEQGDLVMDSEAAAAGFAALRSQAPERSAELASAMQRAFYQDGKSLSDPDTYREIAEQSGLDAEAAVTFMNAPETVTSVRNEFIRVSRLGIQGYPTLLLRKGDSLYQLGGGSTTLAALEERLAGVLG